VCVRKLWNFLFPGSENNSFVFTMYTTHFPEIIRSRFISLPAEPVSCPDGWVSYCNICTWKRNGLIILTDRPDKYTGLTTRLGEWPNVIILSVGTGSVEHIYNYRWSWKTFKRKKRKGRRLIVDTWESGSVVRLDRVFRLKLNIKDDYLEAVLPVPFRPGRVILRSPIGKRVILDDVDCIYKLFYPLTTYQYIVLPDGRRLLRGRIVGSKNDEERFSLRTLLDSSRKEWSWH